MVTIVVSHNTEIVALLIAVCIQLFYGTKTKILIVRSFDGGQKAQAIAPWCGVSTISGSQSQTWMLHRHTALARILAPSLLFIDRIRIQDVARNEYMTPDLPISRSKSRILADISTGSTRYLALFYNPEISATKLRQFLLNSLNVSFLSVTSYTALSRLVSSLPGRVSWVDLLGGFDLSKNWSTSAAIESLVLSHMSSVRFSQGSGALPSSLLWLPKFKASTGMNPFPKTTSRMVQHSNVTHVEIISTNLSYHEQEFCSRYDLMYGLGICDKVLDSLETALRAPSKF